MIDRTYMSVDNDSQSVVLEELQSRDVATPHS